MTVSYRVPGEGFEREEVEFVFSYDASPGTTIETTTDSDVNDSGGALYTSLEDSFRILVPRGWVMWDVENAVQNTLGGPDGLDRVMIAELCPMSGAVPQIGGGYTCSPSDEQPRVSIHRYGNLTARPEFRPLVSQGQNITISDFVAFMIQQMSPPASGNPNAAQFEVEENEERIVPVFDASTNRTLDGVTAPATYLTLKGEQRTEGYLDLIPTQVYYSAMSVLSLDGDTGYSIIPTGSIDSGEDFPSGTEDIVGSFELVVPPSISTTTPPTVAPPTVAPPTVAPPQQEQQLPSPSTSELVL
jgi:hypothetical protein